MKILIIEDKACSEFGGAEKSMFDYILHLKNEGNEIILVYAREGTWMDVGKKLIFSAIYKLDLRPPSEQGLSYIQTLLTLNRICKKHEIYKILTHTVHCFPLLRMLKFLTRVELIVYFKWVVNHENIGRLNNWGIKAVDKAFANSLYVANYWKKQNLKCKIEILPNGIMVPRNLKSNTSFQKINELLYIGRIYEGKGLLRLIKTLSNFPSLSLTVCGIFDINKDHENIEYHKLISDTIFKLGTKNRVIFKGFVADPTQLMKPETLVIIPSIWPESSSRVLYEAMMTKTSVIASEVGGMGEVTGKYRTKCLFGPSESDLTERISIFLNMSYTKRSEIADYLYIRFINHYNIGHTHKMLDQVVL